jgi:alpha-tubulin suppressor-like RCC1 family protein
VAGGLAFRQVAAGALHSCGVTTDDLAYCWGHNQAGELGDGTVNGSLQPVRVARALAFRQVSAGDQFTCGVTTQDVAYCWGMNTFGQLGVGSDTGPESCFTGDSLDPCSTRPARVVRGLHFDRIDVGSLHACGVTTDHVAFCWGRNEAGELGHRTNTGPELCFDLAPCSTRPIRVASKLLFGGVSGGASHTCGVTTGRVAYCWGSNGSGELGIGTRSGPESCFGLPCSTRPVEVVGDRAFTGVQAGERHSCGVRTGNVALCWGDNATGQLGDGTTQRRLRPRRVVAGG